MTIQKRKKDIFDNEEIAWIRPALRPIWINGYLKGRAEVLAEVEKIIEKCFDDINLSYDDCMITYEFKERLKQKIQALSEKDKSEGKSK